MKLLTRTTAAAIAMAVILSPTPAIACATPTPEQIAKWQDRKDAARKFSGVYREVSRSVEIRQSKEPETEGDLEITTVKGVVIGRGGLVRATVYYVFTNELLICRSGQWPKDGKSGTVFAEKGDDKRLYVIDFVEKRNR